MKQNQYCLLGNPVNHSQSPKIHTAFAKATGLELTYTRKLVEKAEFEKTVIDFFNKGGKGLNITSPFKQKAYSIADQVSCTSKIANAANTLFVNKKNQLIAYNTDGVGLVRDIKNNLACQLLGNRILILGAGGVARCIMQPLIEQNPRHIVIANRTHGKAQAIAQEFNQLGIVTACKTEELNTPFDWIINATTANWNKELPMIPSKAINNSTRCYDITYSKSPTIFNRWALAKGIRHFYDGLGMLVEQAAGAFYLWHNIWPKTSQVLYDLRIDLKK